MSDKPQKQSMKIKAQMVATGFITYPDGTKKEVVLRAETPAETLTNEDNENGNNTSKCS